MKKFISLAIALLFVVTAFAQEDKKEKPDAVFKVDGQFRTKFEYRDGLKTLINSEADVAPEIMGVQRSRLQACYHNDKITSKFSVQDVRLMGQSRTAFNNTLPIYVYEAWAKYNFTPCLGLKVGRQELHYKNGAYSDGMVLWNRNWNDYGATHDALVFQFEKKLGDNMLNIDFGGAVNANGKLTNTAFNTDATPSSIYKEMAFLNATFKTKMLTFNFIDLFEGIEKPGTSTTVYGKNTLGVTPVFKLGGLKVDGSFFYQMGTTTSGAEIAAMSYIGSASYDLGLLKVRAGYHAQSGNDGETEAFEMFSTPYGAKHKFYGYMHYHLGGIDMSKGLNDINFQLTVKKEKKKGKKKIEMASFNVVGHLLTTQYEMTKTSVDEAGNSTVAKFGNSVGTDLDIFVMKKFKGAKGMPGMTVKAGYSAFLPSADFTAFKLGADQEARFAHWAWAMIVFKPNFFTHKKYPSK